MTTSPDTTNEPPEVPDSSASREEIQQDIERTREELGATVEALTQRLDVKSRMTSKAAETKSAAVERVQRDPVVFGAVGAAVVALLLALIIRRWRR